MPYTDSDLEQVLAGPPSGGPSLVNENEQRGYSDADLNRAIGGQEDSAGAISQRIAAQRHQNALPKTWFGEATSGFGRGVDQMQQTIYGAGALASDAVGLEGARDFFLKAVQEQDEEIAENPTNVGTFAETEGKGFDGFMRYLFSGAGEVAPNLIESVVTGLAGAAAGSATGPGALGTGVAGLIGKQAAKRLIKEGVEGLVDKGIENNVKRELIDYVRGGAGNKIMREETREILANKSRQVAGQYGATNALAMSSVSQEVGSIYNDLKKDPNIAESDRKVAALVGGITAAIPEVFFEGWIASKFFKGAKNVPKEQLDQAKNYLVRFAQNYGKEVIKTMPGESGQEYLQTVVEEAAKNWADPARRDAIFSFTPEQKAAFVDASFKGAIGGGLGGTIAAAGETKLTPHTDPLVRKYERDLATRADDLTGPAITAEIGTEDERLSAIGTRRTAIEEELSKPETTPEQKAILSAELEKLNADENEIFGEEAAEAEALVNENESQKYGNAPADPRGGLDLKSWLTKKESEGVSRDEAMAEFSAAKDESNKWLDSLPAGAIIKPPGSEWKYTKTSDGTLINTDGSGGVYSGNVIGFELISVPGSNKILTPEEQIIKNEQRATMFFESAVDGGVQAGMLGEDPATFGGKKTWDQLTPEQKQKAMEKFGLPKVAGKEPVSTLTPIQKAEAQLRAFLGNKMGTGQSSKVQESIDQTAVARKREELQALVNENVSKSKATQEEKDQYIKEHMDAFDEATLNFLAKEGIQLRLPTKGELKSRFGGEKAYAVFDDDQGNIVFTIPDLDTIQTGLQSENPLGVAQARKSEVATTKTVVGHELIHVADMVNIRNAYKDEAQEGESFSDFEARYTARRGELIRKAIPELKKVLHHTYFATEGDATDRELGQEFMRMLVESARTGTLTEVTGALVRAEQEAVGNKKGALSEFLAEWINAIRKIHDQIKSFFDPKTAPKEVLEQFNQINEVLDRYGVLVNEKQQEQQRTVPEEKSTSDRATVSPLVTESQITVGEALLTNAKVEQAGQRGRLVEDDGQLILRTTGEEFLIQDSINRDTQLSDLGVKVLKPSTVKLKVREAKEELDQVTVAQAEPIIAAEQVEAEPQFYIDASNHPILNSLYNLIEVGQSRQPRQRKLVQETPEYKRLLAEVSPETLNRAENIILNTIDRIDNLTQVTQERRDQLSQPFYDLWNGIEVLREQLTKLNNEREAKREAASREIQTVLPTESNEPQSTTTSEEQAEAKAPKRKRLTKSERAKSKLDKAIQTAKEGESRVADAMKAYINYQREIGEEPTGKGFQEIYGTKKGASLKLFSEVIGGMPLVNEKSAAKSVNYNSFWINQSGEVRGSVSYQQHEAAAMMVLGGSDDVYKRMNARGWRRGAVFPGERRIYIDPKGPITPAMMRFLERMSEERGMEVFNETSNRVIIEAPTDKSAAKAVMFHGTSEENAQAIDDLGFDLTKPGEVQRYGPGLYVTDNFTYAKGFGNDFIKGGGRVFSVDVNPKKIFDVDNGIPLTDAIKMAKAAGRDDLVREYELTDKFAEKEGILRETIGKSLYAKLLSGPQALTKSKLRDLLVDMGYDAIGYRDATPGLINHNVLVIINKYAITSFNRRDKSVAKAMPPGQIARQLNLSYDGVMMERLDVYTDQDEESPSMGTTFSVPIDSDFDTVEQTLRAKQAEFAAVSNMLKGAAKAATTRSARDEREVKVAFAESNEIHNNRFSVLPIREQERKRVQGKVPWENATAMDLWYNTRPHTNSAIAAQALVNENGNALKVAEILRTDVLGESLGLKEDKYGPDSQLKAVYENVIMQLISAEAKLLYSEVSIGTVGYLRDLRRDLEQKMRMMGNETGSFNAYTGMSEKLYTGESARREYVDTAVENAQKVLGKDAKKKMSKLTSELNGLWDKYAGVVVNRAPVIALLRKLHKLVDKSKFEKGYRKTIIKSIDKLQQLTKKAAAKAADFMSLKDDGEAYVNRAIERMISEMTGLPKDISHPEELALFQSVLTKMAKTVGKEMGIISPTPTQKPPTMLEQMTAVLKNESLYNMFVNGLYKTYVETYGGKNPEPSFIEQAEVMYSRLSSKMWRDGMVQTLVNEKMRELNMSFAKIAKAHYSKGTSDVDDLKVQIMVYMREQGVDNPDLIEQLAQDIDANMSERIEVAREKFFTSKGAIRGFLKQAQTTLAQAAKEHATYVDGMERHFEQSLEKMGIPNEPDLPIAKSIAEVMQAEFNKLVKAERGKILARWVEQAKKGQEEKTKRKMDQVVARVLQLSNLGAMRLEDVYKALQEKFDLPKYSEETAREIENLGNKIGQASLPRQKEILTQHLADFLAANKGMKTSDAYTSWMYFSMLSGPGTQLVNIGGNASSLVGYVILESIKHPSRAPRMLAALIRTAIGKGQIEARESFFTGLALGKQGEKYYRQGNPAELSDAFFTSGIQVKGLKELDEKIAKFSHKVIRGTKGYYIGRALMAADIFFYKVAQEMAYVARTGEFNITPSIWDSAMKKARSSMLAEGVNPDDNSDLKRRQKVLAHSIIEQERLHDKDGVLVNERQTAWEEANQEALDATFSQEPKGFLGFLAKHLERFTADWPIGKLIIPFTRVAANVTNQMLEWTPYGFARYAFMGVAGNEKEIGNWKGNMDVALRAGLGTAAIFGLLALAASDRDEEDPFFTIYGDGPRDLNARRQLQQRGWKPNTIKVGDKFISYLYTPLAMALSIVGRHMDDYRDGRIPDPRDLSLATSSVALIEAIKNQSFLAGAADLMSAVDSPDPVAKVSRVFARMTTIPIPNLLKQVDRLVDPSVQEGQGFWESVIKEIPIARHLRKPAINIFGEEVERIRGPLPFPGMDRFVTLQKTDDPVLNLLSENRLIVPGISKSTRMGDRNMTQDEYYDYVKLVGPRVKSRINAEILSLDAMSREDAQERLERISLEEKKKARREMMGSR
jgi:hypothetical protein